MNMWFASHPQLFRHPPESNRPGCDKKDFRQFARCP
jgi:hypothetical protein